MLRSSDGGELKPVKENTATMQSRTRSAAGACEALSSHGLLRLIEDQGLATGRCDRQSHLQRQVGLVPPRPRRATRLSPTANRIRSHFSPPRTKPPRNP